MKKPYLLVSLLALTACSLVIEPTIPVNNTLSFTDHLPKTPSVAPAIQPTFYASHLATANLPYEYTVPCSMNQSSIVVRKPADITMPSNTRLLQHSLSCDNNLTLNNNQSVTITETSPLNRQASFSFTSVNAMTPPNGRITVITESTIEKNNIDDITIETLLERLLNSTNISPPLTILVEDLITNIANDQLPNFVNPQAEFSVIAQSVNYQSTDPNGNRIASLSGLVAFPDTSTVSGFIPKNEVILLTHSTGVTPSDRNADDIWYQLATILASRGYTVIAPDNFGRGTSRGAASPETYLQAKRTASNAVDLVNVVIESGHYTSVLPASGPIKDVIIMGYSQGGHTAVATWQEILHSHNSRLNTVKLFAGGGPYNVYDTFKGVMKYVEGSCLSLPVPIPTSSELLNSIADPYCAFINDSLVEAYAIKRILPPLLAYGETGLSEAQLINGNTINSTFASGFIDNEPQYNTLKLLLQLNSFTNIENKNIAFNDPDLHVHLYHSDFDRLVIKKNNIELMNALQDHTQSLNDHSSICNTDALQASLTIPQVGVAHALCGAVMMNHVLGIIN